MNKLAAILSIFYVLGTLIVVCIISFLFIRRVPDLIQVQTDRLVPIYSKKPLDQSFISNFNGLNSISIYLKNRSLLNTQPLIFNLHDASGDLVREINISGRNIGDGESVRFQFEPISDSMKKKYLLHLSAPLTLQNDVPIEAGFSNSDTYMFGSSDLAYEPGDLSFQTYYRPQNRVEQLSGIIQHWQNLLSWRFLISILIVTQVFTVTARVVGFRYN